MSSQQDQLVSLALQSKKALQSGEQLCSRAHTISNASANISIDVIALDAKVRWITEAVGDQLKLVASVSKNIAEERAAIEKEVQEWDKLRKKHSDTLESVLDSLESQLVPPDFHQNASEDSSLFGSQHSDGERDRKPNGSIDESSTVSHSPSSTLRIGLWNAKPKGKEKSEAAADKRAWKTLRDFVDDQAVEDVLQTMENDRLRLDYILSKTDEYPETLATTIESIGSSLPDLPSDPSVKFTEETLAAQDVIITSMAAHLESLTSHYEQMANAVQESANEEPFGEEDLSDMNRDTDELPLIMAELEESADAVDGHYEKLQAAKENSQSHLSLLVHTLDDLDELGDIMLEMLQTQEEAGAKCRKELSSLHNHLLAIEHLRDRFVSYQTAFNKLILELARRQQYREAAQNIVRGMTSQLEAMTEEEREARNRFNTEYGAHLPEDICLCVGNAPTRWEVVPWSGDALETLPLIDNDLIIQAKDWIHTELERAPGGLAAEGL